MKIIGEKKESEQPVLRLFSTGRGTRVEFMGRDVSKGMTYFKYEHNAKDKEKPEVTMVFDMSFFEPLEDGEFDRAYKRYCEYLEGNTSDNNITTDAAREDDYELSEINDALSK